MARRPLWNRRAFPGRATSTRSNGTLVLILAIVAAGSALGLLAARRVQPVYDVQSTVWIASGVAPQSGPIRPQQLLPATSWVELLRSYAIIDPVVRKLRLNVSYRQPGDSIFFGGFESLASLRAGAYVLKIEPGGRYVLSTAKGIAVERGAVGDSIGRKMGFGWAPDARLLTPGRVLTVLGIHAEECVWSSPLYTPQLPSRRWSVPDDYAERIRSEPHCEHLERVG